MKISTRSVLMAGAVTITAGAVAIAPSVQPLPPPKPDIQLSASSQAFQTAAAQPLASPAELAGLLRAILLAPGIGTPPPEPPEIPPLPGTNSLASFIDSAYLAIEPWVAYGFEVGAWAFSWVPYIGWLAPQIWPIGYEFGERLVRAIVFNITDWLQGDGSFVDNLVDWGAESINALIDFGIDQWYFWIGFPLPPLPGIFTAAAPATTLAGLTAPEVGVTNVASDLVNAVYTPISNTITYGVEVFQSVLAPIPFANIAGDQASILWNILADPIADSVVYDLIDPVLNQPLNINSYLNGAYDVGATTVNALINTGFAEVNYFLGSLPFVASTQESQLNRAAEVSSVPSIVKKSLAPVDRPQTEVDQAPSEPLRDVAKTVRNVRNEIRTAFTDRRDNELKQGEDAADAGNDVVRTQGARGPVGRAVADAADALRGGKPNKDTDGATTTKSVAKSLGDTARKVVKDVRQAAKDARNTAKDGPAGEAAA